MPLDAALLDLFLELVSIDAPSRHERPVADLIRGRLEALGFEVREDGAGEATGGDCGNLTCRFRGGGRFALMAHMDTVAPTLGLVPRHLDDRIAADPAGILGADDRAGVAAILHAVEAHIRAGGGPATALFTVQEEVNLVGAGRLEWPRDLEGVYVFDSSHRPGAWIAAGWGARRFAARFHGRSAHAAVAPERGVHAIVAAARAIAACRWGRLDDEATANVGTIGGGTATNVVAAEAQVEGEVRASRLERLEEVIEAIDERFRAEAAHLGAALEIDWQAEFEPYRHDRASALIRRLLESMRAAGLEARAEATAGGSDAHVLNARGLPAVNLGIGAQNPHGPDELILVDDLAAAARLAGALLAAPAEPAIYPAHEAPTGDA